MKFADTEFYYADPQQIDDKNICLKDEEARHLAVVMRHSAGDLVKITDGLGNVFNTKIKLISKSSVILEIEKQIFIPEKFPKINIFIPLLKSSDRMELALEKCVELGFTNFVIFSAEKSPKKNIKLNRLSKISLAAMKQSLQSNKPKISLQELSYLKNQLQTINIVLDQLASTSFKEIIKDCFQKEQINLIFGPEAGLTVKDTSKIPDSTKVFLTNERLRAETAIITAASLIAVNCVN